MMTAFWDVALCSLIEVDQVSEMHTASIIRAMMINLMMEAVCTSETSVYFYKTTQHCIPEGCHLHIHRHDNLNSHSCKMYIISNSAVCQLLSVLDEVLFDEEDFDLELEDYH
jgi:hypothetical protein